MQSPPDDQSSTTPGWQYASEPADQPTQPQAGHQSKAAGPVTWTASEFIAHEKNIGWYGLLALAGVAGAATIYLLTGDRISSGMAIIVALALGILAGRKPRTLTYQVDQTGIHIGDKTFGYTDFKSYSVIDEGPLSSISLLPLKRFRPPTSIYYDPADEERIANILGDYLPYVEGQKDPIDRLMHRIRF